jgi:hypothetical protein
MRALPTASLPIASAPTARTPNAIAALATASSEIERACDICGRRTNFDEPVPIVGTNRQTKVGFRTVPHNQCWTKKTPSRAMLLHLSFSAGARIRALERLLRNGPADLTEHPFTLALSRNGPAHEVRLWARLGPRVLATARPVKSP